MIDLSYIIPDMKARNMKETINIKYNGKTFVIPKPFNQCDFSDEPLTMETITNPFSGQSIAMPRFAVAIYDVIMGSNLMAENYDAKHGVGSCHLWHDVRKGLDWFRKNFAKEYMVLLD